jgi:hypothetical protein
MIHSYWKNIYIVTQPLLFCFCPYCILQLEAEPPTDISCPLAPQCTFAASCPTPEGGCATCNATGFCNDIVESCEGSTNCCATPNGRTFNCNAGCGRSQNCITGGNRDETNPNLCVPSQGILCDNAGDDLAIFNCLLTGFGGSEISISPSSSPSSTPS